MNRFHPGDDLPEGSIFSVQRGKGLLADKKLRGCAVRVIGARHGNDSLGMLQGIGFAAVFAEFSLNCFSGAAVAGSFRIPALNQHAGFNPMKDQPVVKAFFNQFYEVLNGFRCVFRIKLDLKDPAVFHFDADETIVGCCLLSAAGGAEQSCRYQ